MKVLYSSDLHGKINLFGELKKYVINYSIEILILGGDILPSSSVQKLGYEKLIPNQRIFFKQFLFDFFKRLSDIKSLKKIFLISGNWDIAYSCIFDETLDKIIDLNLKSYKLHNEYELIGYPFVPPTPFRTKDYEKRDDIDLPIPTQKNPSYIQSRINKVKLRAVNPYEYLKTKETIKDDLLVLPKPADFKKTIYVMHSPPFETKLDLIEGGKSCGSRSIKKFIENFQPLLTLHGHIHESPKLTGSYKDRIGNTISINPGQFSSKNLQAVVFELEHINKTILHTSF